MIIIQYDPSTSGLSQILSHQQNWSYIYIYTYIFIYIYIFFLFIITCIHKSPLEFLEYSRYIQHICIHTCMYSVLYFLPWTKKVPKDQCGLLVLLPRLEAKIDFSGLKTSASVRRVFSVLDPARWMVYPLVI